ncbi:MAG TPA: 16S rRNA (adenine(1518)-N(6)/adenine(1519)-N(6))-dimethyltransferase RsmA [Candidatus Binataceae bacterium]|nr:16S rRNA (adenine(1518)-N(6)/adenine(1519)-N(6))-dimethyltransferase RsmA [Candidatus Binataceae bacterium]
MRELADFRPQKSKGQNFLTQPRIADRIAAAAQLESFDNVIEIGPGLGILSEAILRYGVRSLMMIELDPRLAAILRHRMSDRPGVSVINADFLNLCRLPADGPSKIVANLPFNVASAILERLCAEHARITMMVLMFQREVAERIRARPGDSAYGALSAYTALYWNVIDHFRVAAGNFNPRPKVDAEVLVFMPRRPPLFEGGEEQVILRTIRAAFTQPRKTLRNSLASGLGYGPAITEALLQRAAINPGARAATLALNDFLRLARVLASQAATADARHA